MHQFTQAWLTLVIDISIKSILLAGVAGLALSLLRVRDTNLRHRVWTAVLLGMLAMPALVYVTPAVPLPGWLARMIPSPATTDNSIAEQTDTPSAAHIEKNLPGPADETLNPLDPAALVKSTGNELPLPTHGVLRVPPLADMSTANPIAETRPSSEAPASGALNGSRVSLILAGLYFFVAIVFLGRLLLGLTLTYRITRQAREIHLSTPLSLPRRRNLRLLESDAVHVPATVGCMRPVVLLPRCWPQWSEAKLRAVLAHELAHLERADWLVITLAELNRAVYWFHPLAWFVRNRLSELAEQNCDDAVLAADGDRTQYARYLLEVAGSLTTAGARYRPPRHSIAMARKPNVETRIEAILDIGRPLARRLSTWGIVCLLAIGVPAILLAAALRTSSDDAQTAVSPGAMKSAAKFDESNQPQPAVPQNNDGNHVHDNAETSAAKVNSGAGSYTGTTTVVAITPQPRASDSSQPTQATGKSTEPIQVTGHVLDERGAAVANVRVIATQSRWIDRQYLHTEHRQAAETRSRADGSFTITVPPLKPVDYNNRQLTFDWKPSTIMAVEPGRISSWVGGGELPNPAENPFAGDLVLHLDRHSTPIQGRLVSLEGQPLSGLKVAVKMLAIALPTTVEPWLAVAEQKRRDGSLPPLKSGAGTLTLSSFSNAMVWDSSMTSASSSPEPKWSPYYPMTSRLLPQHPQLSVGAKTNAEGRFEIEGLPADSLAVLEISGPGVETHTISVINRDFQRLDVPGTGYPGAESNAYYGAKFDHPVPPGVSLVGTVTDKESAKPIVGAQVSASVVENQMLRNQSQWTSVSGPNGEYRIDGLPLAGKKELEVVPAAEQPYLVAKGLAAPEAAAGKPGSMEIKLRRGVLVHGRVTDAETGAPIKAIVQYNPLLSNEHARDFSYDPQLIRFELGDDRQFTNADGMFHTVVIPGQGILGVQCDQWNDYCAGLGSEKLEVMPDARFATYNLMSPKAFNTVAQIDVPASAQSIERDLKVSRGINLKVNVRDPQGKPLNGVMASGLSPFGQFGDAPASDATLEFRALRPGETRRVMLLHRDRHLGQILELTAPEKGGAPEARTVALEPCGTVIGSLVNGEKEPVAGVQLTAFAGMPRNFDALVPQQIATAADGKFRFEFLPPGANYNISGFSPQFNGIEVAKEMKLAPGETVDFGTIDISSKKRPEPIRKQASAGAASAKLVALASTTESAPMPAAKDSRRLIVHGRIVGFDGKPAAGADVAVIGMKADSGRGGDLQHLGVVLAEAKTNSAGEYRLELSDVSSKTHRSANVIARGNASAVAWKKLNLDANDFEAAFEFKPEQTISGRLVDIDGQAAAGVHVQIAGIMTRVFGDQFPQEGVGFLDCPKTPAAWPQPIVADDQGRFAVHGVSKDDGISLDVEGNDRFAPQSISLNTGMAEQRGERDGTYRSLVKNLKPGEEGVLPLAPAQLFTGTVRFEDTGEPAPKARLTIWASQQNSGSMVAVAGKADDQGKYKINPNPGVRFGVTAYPPDGAPYLVRQVQPIAWQSGDRSREVDVKLSRGVLVRGKVLEQGSDAPIAGASIQYIPETANNPNKPAGVLTGWQDTHKSDAEGRFQIVVLPGPGRLLVHGPQNDFVFQESSQRELYQGRAGGQRNYAHGIERIEPAANAEPLEVNFHLKRGGALAGEIVDEQGAAVNEASMLSRLQISPLSLNWRGFPTPVMDGRFELTGLAADQEYPVYFLESKRRLGATLLAKSSMERPRVVLKPCGDAKMRFVDADGKPIAGYEPMLQIVVTPGELNLVRLNQNNGTLTADADFIANVDRVNHAGRDKSDREGRLTVPALIPGATYRVVVMRNKAWSMGKELVAKAGETIDLGDITVERPE